VSGQLHVSAALPPEKDPQYPSDRKLGGPQSRSGRCREEKIFDHSGTQTPTYRSFSPYLVPIPLELSSSSPIFRKLYCLNLQDNGISQAIHQACRLLLAGICLVSSAVLNVDTVRSSETFSLVYPSTRSKIPEDSILHNQLL
jgi:hypothetical protein